MMMMIRVRSVRSACKNVHLVMCYLNIVLAYSCNIRKVNMYCCFHRHVSSKLKYVCTILRIIRSCYYDNVP